MRYAACTPEDIKFLKTHIAIRPTQTFRQRIQKDRINELGSVHFAAETGQTLTDFYSIDRFGSSPDVAEKRSKGRK